MNHIKNRFNKYGIRKYMSLAVCFLLIVTTVSMTINTSGGMNSKDNCLSYSFAFMEPGLQTAIVDAADYTLVQMSGCMMIGEQAGDPMLPVKPVKLLLPAKTMVTSVIVTGSPVEIVSVDTPVFPYQNPVPFGFEPEEFQFNTGLYASDSLYPSRLFDDYHVGYCRGYAILDITLNPVQYIPVSGRVFYYPEMTVTIDLEKTGEVSRFFRNNLDDKYWVERLVYNPEVTETYTSDVPVFDYPGGLCDPSDDFDYVIITTTYNGLDYWETTGSIPYNWDSLMTKHEQVDGLHCTLVTIQDINTCSDYWNSTALFNDTEAHIREFCRDAYQDWGVSYVFIGGDDEWIPARHMKYAYESDVDSDLYWSNLDNNFNADGDMYWGEEGDLGFDLYSELFIGRITCDEPQDVSNWMTKSFYYADSGDLDYLENAAFYGGDTGWLCEGDDFIDYSAVQGFEAWNNGHPEMPYNLSVKWTAEPPNPGWQGGSQDNAIAGLKNAINNDHVTLISGIAHADAGRSLDVHMEDWESDYHNTKPFFIHDQGNHCGDMDAPGGDGVLHSMLFHSDTYLAFACVYNSCFGWASNNSPINSSSPLQQKLFWDYFFDLENNSGSFINWQLGKAMAYSKDIMAPTINWDLSYGTWRAIIQGCLLFGDPAQRIKAPCSPSCYPVLDGTTGENSWYVSDVSIIFKGSGCESVYYKIDDGEWATYVAPIVISEDGVHLFCWFYVDNEGNLSDVECIEIKIDKTDPTIDLTVEKIGFRKWLITADVYDETSGIKRVEFHLNNEYLGETTIAPYVWTVTKKGTAQAIVYDNAGNSVVSTEVPVIRPVSYSQSQSSPSSGSQSQSQSIYSTIQRLILLR